MAWQDVSILLSKLWPVLSLGAVGAVAYAAIRRRAITHARTRQSLRQIQERGLEPHTLHPRIDPLRCAGCGACVSACPEGEILQLVDHRAVLAQPTKCVGHGECEAACPFGAITLVFGTKRRGMELPRLTGHYETSVPGLYIAGELGGMGLIRNAVKQGRLAAEHALGTLRGNEPRADIDLLIVGAGAAGLSAGLAAVAAKRRYRIVEQHTLGGTVANFPRQKVVMSQPAVLPLVGEMRFPGNKVTKEALLGYWAEVRRRARLKITENCRFLSLQQDAAGLFQVETSLGRISARRVLLAMGVRGTPRRLNLPNEDLPKVTYNLIEPEQYQGRRIAVVGAGNAGVEAAIQLAQPRYGNKVILLVRGGGLDRCNAENQAAAETMAARGELRIVLQTSVTEIQPDYLMISTQGGEPRRIANDFLFIFAGAEMPFEFLRGLGVSIEKKFGEPARRR